MSRILACCLLAFAIGLTGPAFANDPVAVTGTARTIRITARRFEYQPSIIEVSVGETITLELVSLDRRHGFKVPGLHLEAEIRPGETTRLTFTPLTAGTYPFHCSVFCGSGHEDMSGAIVVRAPH